MAKIRKRTQKTYWLNLQKKNKNHNKRTIQSQNKSFLSKIFSSNFYSFCFAKKTHYFSIFSLISFCHLCAYLFLHTPHTVLCVIFILILVHFKLFMRKCTKLNANKAIRLRLVFFIDIC